MIRTALSNKNWNSRQYYGTKLVEVFLKTHMLNNILNTRFFNLICSVEEMHCLRMLFWGFDIEVNHKNLGCKLNRMGKQSQA